MRIGNKDFDTKNKTYVMGILNVTPDSFSDGGCWNQLGIAISHAERMKRAGAAIIDVGGESTRPGHEQISAWEEIDRVVPVIEQLKKQLGIPISIDTYKSEVAEAALEAGADMVNDIWGLMYDKRMAEVIAKHNAVCCLSHNRNNNNYNDIIKDISCDLAKSVFIAVQAGVGRDNIILDPGIGFAKNYEQNLEVLRRMGELTTMGHPMLLGASRKSVIGETLELPADEREEGTIATTVLAVQNGYSFVRVHDVEKNARAIKMTEAIMNR